MTSWTHLVRFTAAEDGHAYYTTCDSTLPAIGRNVTSFKSIAALETENVSGDVKTIKEASSQEHQVT
jgi:hypothetical protein